MKNFKWLEYSMLQIMGIVLVFTALMYLQKSIDYDRLFGSAVCFFALLACGVIGSLAKWGSKDVFAIPKNLLVGAGLYYAIAYFKELKFEVILMGVALLLSFFCCFLTYVSNEQFHKNKKILLKKRVLLKICGEFWDATLRISGIFFCTMTISLIIGYIK